MEISSEHGISFQPVLIVRFQPVNSAMFENKEGNRTIDGFLVFQTVNLIVFIQAVLQLLTQLIVRLVLDSQYVDSIVFS